MIQNVFIRNVSFRFYAKSKFCVCFEVHIPVAWSDNRTMDMFNAITHDTATMHV